jgi:hypothetical protein
VGVKQSPKPNQPARNAQDNNNTVMKKEGLKIQRCHKFPWWKLLKSSEKCSLPKRLLNWTWQNYYRRFNLV